MSSDNKMVNKPTRPVEVFYSYAPQDESLRDELEKHLSVLKREELITNWHSRRITAGKEWANEVDEHLNVAQVILLLISPDFVASDYCYNIEMRRALERHQAGEACVIPIILRPIYWAEAPFSKLQVLPTDGKPVTSWHGRHGRDKAFLNIAKGIRQAIQTTDRNVWGYKITSGIDHQYSPLNDAIALIQVDRADTLYNLKQYKEALTAYEMAIHSDPYCPLAYNGKGDVLYKLKRYKEALPAYEKAITLNPRDALVHYHKGDVLHKLNCYQEALVAYELAICFDPEDPIIYSSKGNLLYELKRYWESLVIYELALRLDPNDATAIVGQSNVFIKLGLHQGILSDLNLETGYDPTSAITHYNMGLVHHKLKHYEEALASYDQAIFRNSLYAIAYLGKADTLVCLGRYEEALRTYDIVLEDTRFDNIKSSDNWPHIMRRAYKNKEDTLYNINLYEKASTVHNVLRLHDSMIYCKKGNTLYELGHYMEALDNYNQAISHNSSNGLAYHGKSQALLKLGRLEEAKQAFQKSGEFGDFFIL